MANKNESFADYTLKQIYFSDKQKSEYGMWISATNYDLEKTIFSLCEYQLKASISLDQNTGDFLFSLTVKDRKSPVHKNVFMFRHADPVKLYSIALFYYAEVLDGGSSKPQEESDTDW